MDHHIKHSLGPSKNLFEHMNGKKEAGLLVAAVLMQRISGFSDPNQRHELSMNKDVASTRFPHIHSDITTILEHPSSFDGSRESASSTLVDPETLEILWRPNDDSNVDKPGDTKPVSTQLLVDLAYASDDVLYKKTRVLNQKSMQVLAEMGQQDDSLIVTAALLALNRLESAIRRTTGYTAGRAPLLKHMVTQLDDRAMAAILMTLLLPIGLNLRNLLWHGFCASNLPRRWLSLVLILTHNLERNDTQEMSLPTCDEELLMDMMNHPSVRDLLTSKRSDADSLAILKGWLPASHHGLLKLAWTWKLIRPACSAALLSIILEHSLRLDWCRLNDSPANAIARPGAYYVTLDGHGQKHQHDLLLYPLIGNGCNENNLIAQLGGFTAALLTDLYASSCGGPNLRAALAHGLWDTRLERELAAGRTVANSNDAFVDMVNLVIVAMEGAALSPRSALRRYHPLFSYRAFTLRNLENETNQVQRLVSLQHSPFMTKDQLQNDHIATLNVSNFDEAVTKVRNVLRISNGEWKAEHVFQEHEINVVLAENGASSTLLEDLAVSTSSFTCIIEDALSKLHDEDEALDRRLRNRLRLSDIAITMYRFATYVAVLSLDQGLRDDKDLGKTMLPPEVMLKAVERSRMCVSTFSNYLTLNTERALKAAVEYTKGKAVKTILQYNQQKVMD